MRVQARNKCIITNEAGKIPQSGPTGRTLTTNVETIKLQYRIKELPLNKLKHNVRALSRGRQYYYILIYYQQTIIEYKISQ